MKGISGHLVEVAEVPEVLRGIRLIQMIWVQLKNQPKKNQKIQENKQRFIE